MKYRELKIQTQREAPNNARCEGAAWLARAGYLSREGEVLPLGERALARLETLWAQEGDGTFARLALPVLKTTQETFFAMPAGAFELLHCPACGQAARASEAAFRKFALPSEGPNPLEKVLTPECNTIEALASFLGIPKEKTAKALMFTRKADGKLIFAVVRGDMTLSETKLQAQVGEVRLAKVEEIEATGAFPGYASPIGLKDVLVIVDELVPVSANLAAGANEAGYHLLNTNCGRDYTPDLIADLALAQAGDPCMVCNTPLEALNAELLVSHGRPEFRSLLLALAEANHDQKGLALPREAAPFEIYLMQVTGKEIDTLARAGQVYAALEAAGKSVLFDDRDERAGVKFNDADLIGCPVRITVGERALREAKLEVKGRREKESRLVGVDEIGRMIGEG